MKLVIGLGNPGADYRRTRHNLGFMVMDELARGWGVKFKGHSRSNSHKAEFCFKGQAVILAKPQTFMNLSGDTAGKLIRLCGIKIQDILVVCDDIRLELGSIRIREKGSAGGHNGLASIIEVLGSDGFARLRVGASCADVRGDLSRYVLADFPEKDRSLLREGISKAAEAVESWIGEGIEKTMSRFNRRSAKE